MLRLMDANLDRLSEGLRVLEDVSRFILDDIRTTEVLKRIRHDLTPTDPALKNKLLTARDSARDVGREGSGIAGTERHHIADLVTANARRAQQSLRVLEEFTKLPQTPDQLKERNFEQARYTLYEIERELTLNLTRYNSSGRIVGLYVIIDNQTLAGHSEIEAARQAIEGGAGVVQYRDKYRPRKESIPVARELKRICAETGVLFIVNDSIDIAMAIDADGVHIGQSDLPLSIAKDLLPPDRIIGCSVRTVEQAIQAQKEGADYLVVGDIYHTPTKQEAEAIGLERLSLIKDSVSLPIVAFGGINETNAGKVIKAGADSIAVISAIL
ncbi:MAG: thiamine phosphate synthase, partial [Chloroflexota bacterium]|nr:thiamine phosphate synthase [Chloroflexota bacterium]